MAHNLTFQNTYGSFSNELAFHDEGNPYAQGAFSTSPRLRRVNLAPLPSGERDGVRGTLEANCCDVSVTLEALNILELLYVSTIILLTFLTKSLKFNAPTRFGPCPNAYSYLSQGISGVGTFS